METTSDDIYRSDTEEIKENSNGGRAKKFQCSFCRKALSSKQNLKEHEFTHTGELPYVCKTAGCGLRFRQGSVLSAHKRIHGIIDKYVEQDRFKWIKLTDMIKLFEVSIEEVKVNNEEKIELPAIKSPQEFFIEGKEDNQI